MKDYNNIILWLDYFNKTFSKKIGRRTSKEQSVYDPSIKELTIAITNAGFKIVETIDVARYPRRPFVRSGYIAVVKDAPKTKVIKSVATKLLAMRSK